MSTRLGIAESLRGLLAKVKAVVKYALEDAEAAAYPRVFSKDSSGKGALRIRRGIEGAGFGGRLTCGTINLFDGWAANVDYRNPIVFIRFLVGSAELGQLPLQKDRPDLERTSHRRKTGFSGVVNIPNQYFGRTLTLVAVAQDGRSQQIAEYQLNEKLSDAELEFRRANNLPDDMLQYLVVQDIDPQLYLQAGELAVDEVIQVLDDHQVAMSDLKTVLDFGVGCGRVMRWWREWSDRIEFWGTDINPALVEWCNTDLGFGTYRVNAMRPPTGFQDSQFDLIYAFSVFTHLSFETQRAWLEELSRILAPDRYFLVSVHGEQVAKFLPPAAYREYKRMGCYLLTPDAEGQNLCAAYQSQEYSERLFSSRFEVMEYLPGALKACGIQDLYLLRKRS